jgi:hypothetical protein
MALIFPTSTCAICGQGFADRVALFATSGVAFDQGHPLWRFCDAPMHWDCYAAWPHRPEFARAYFHGAIEGEVRNPYWGAALLTDDVFVTANPRPPVAMIDVELAETGSGVRVPLADWDDWLSELDAGIAGLHPLEQEALRRAWPELRSQIPDSNTVVARVDWDAKKRLLDEWHARDRRLMEERLSKTRHHNKACRQMVRDGVACPYCGDACQIRYLDKSPEQKSYFICNACARSFGPVEDAVWRWEREDGSRA